MSELFGPYRILRILALRNQSRIDLVENTAASNRTEVLKRIYVVPGNEENRDLIDAEKQGAELQRQAHIRNPHIIDVYACGVMEECFYVSMEYVEGKNLEQYLKERNGPLGPVEAASIARELCLQVATLHQFQLTIDGKSQAFLHNDIKPSNIQMRKSDNQIRLIDFGAAKTVTYSKNFTRNDFASVAYCSPERLDKGLSDTHSDLWSIAVVLYEMIAGHLPYQASTHQQLEALIRSGAPPMRLAQNCPAALESILYKALSPAVANRYPTAPAFAQDLEKFCVNPQLAPRPASAPSENPTRRVTPPSGRPAVNQMPPQAGPGFFTTQPASFQFKAPAPRARAPYQVPGPMLWLGRAFARKPLLFTFRAAIAIFALYVMLSGCSARRQAQTYYASLEKQDFPAMLASEIDSEAGQLHRIREAFWGRFFTATSGLRTYIKPKLMEAGERPINAYRTDQLRAPSLNDWLHARACLNFATEIDSSDKLARAELDLVEGHLDQTHKQFVDARQKFIAASELAPDSPDPWIALASLDAYHDRNLQALIDDQNKEQQRHYTPVQREAAQRGDLLMFLAGKALNGSQRWRRKNSSDEEARFLHEADEDFEQAEKAYEGSRNWFHTEASIEEIHKRRAAIQERLSELDGSSK